MCQEEIVSKELVDTVADTIILEFYEKAKKSGLTIEQIQKQVDDFISSPIFIEQVRNRVATIIAMFDKKPEIIH